MDFRNCIGGYARTCFCFKKCVLKCLRVKKYRVYNLFLNGFEENYLYVYVRDRDREIEKEVKC